MGKSTISMAIFNSYVTNYQRVWPWLHRSSPHLGVGTKAHQLPHQLLRSATSKKSTGKSAEIHWGMRQLSLFFFRFSGWFGQVHRYDSLKDILGNFQAHVGCSFIKVHRPGPALGCIYHSALQRVTAEEIWAAVAKATSGNSRRRPSTSARAETRAGVPATKVCIPQQRRKRRWSQWGLKKCSTFTTINNPDLCKETFNPTMITFCWRSWKSLLG